MTDGKRVDPLAIVAKLSKQEKQLYGTTFLAPCIKDAKVRLKLNGIICTVEVDEAPEGFALMELVAPGKARLVGPAPLPLVSNYLKLLPRVRLVLLDRFDDQWWAVAASPAGSKICINAPVPVHLMQRGAAFDTIYARFDGGLFLFESADRRRSPTIARELRQALCAEVHPEQLRCKGMVPAERIAYKMLWLVNHEDSPLTPPGDRERIAGALQHSNTRLDSFWYDATGTTASVRFEAGGNTHVVQVRTNDLTIVSAGICLSGRDQDFDLTSIVGVLGEQEYW